MRDAQSWIRTLELEPHPEGGFFRETYRAAGTIPGEVLDEHGYQRRSFSTAIIFLLPVGDFSGFHRLRSDELWHFYYGAPLIVHVLGASGRYEQQLLDPRSGLFQAAVTAGSWFAAEAAATQDPGYSLVGCTVAPGFDFSDFELGTRAVLEQQYPQHQKLIARLCRR